MYAVWVLSASTVRMSLYFLFKPKKSGFPFLTFQTSKDRHGAPSSFVQTYFGHEQKGHGLTKGIVVSVNGIPPSDLNPHHYTNYPMFSRLLQSSWCATDFMEVGM